MTEQIDAKQTVRLLCQAWFVQRDVERTAEFLTDDIQFIGSGKNEHASGKIQMKEYLTEDIREVREPFEIELSVIYERYLCEASYILSAEFVLRNSVYSWHLYGDRKSVV